MITWTPLSQAQLAPMATGLNGYQVANPVWTVGEEINGYAPPGVLDGIGAYRSNFRTVRMLVNHNLLNFRGNAYTPTDFTTPMFGSRVSYFDFDRFSMELVDAGPAIGRIFDANGTQVTDPSFLSNDFYGFSRFCSSQLVPRNPFGFFRGNLNNIYFTGESDGGFFNGVGGAEWALDVRNGDLWQVPAMGRGAWENVAAIDTGDFRQVAFILADDTVPFDFNSDGTLEAAPLFLYVGTKQAGGFLERNGLKDGQLYVWVADDPAIRTPADFNGSGTVSGSWVAIDNSPGGTPSENGSTGFDEYGYPTQANLWLQAQALGAFGFSRPEDVATNPADGTQIVLASTGVDTYVNGADTFGTVYTIKTDFADLTADITIIYDGDADPARQLRSPDNLDWSEDGFIYIQEDEAEEDTLDGEPLFGTGAVNPFEAGIVQIDPAGLSLTRIAVIDRSVVLDASLADPTQAVDTDAGNAGEWETSGILDVSSLFRQAPGSLFIFTVQAHGIEDQTNFNATSRIENGDLVEGGQLLFLKKTNE